jgi:multidrug efflux system outer membrane protein
MKTPNHQRSTCYPALLCLVACALLQGCAGASPNLASTTVAQAESAANKSEQTAPGWWQQLGDPQLDQLVQNAGEQNLDLQKAEARLAEVTAAERGTRAQLAPEIGAQLSAGRQLQNKLGAPANVLSESLTGNWDMDLSGKKSAALRAAGADRQLADASVTDARVQLIARVITTYLDLRNAQSQAAITRQTITNQQDNWELTKNRYEAGLVSQLDVTQAQSQLYDTQAQLPNDLSAINAAQYRLELLLGKEPGTLTQELAAPAPLPAAEDSNQLANLTIPSPPSLLEAKASLVSNRPDVQAAAAAVQAALARSDVARAAQFPDLSLSALFGLQQASPTSTADITGNIWSFGAKLLAPLFTFGRTDAEIAAADARTKQAELAYRQSVLTALSEVESNLSAYLQESAKRQSLIQTVAANRLNLTLAKERYEHGLVSFIEVLGAEQRLYEAQRRLTNASAQTAHNWVQVHQALGVL